MNKKLMAILTAALIVGAITTIGFSLVASPMVKDQADAVQTNLAGDGSANLVVCPIAGYIEETIVAINKDANTIILGDATDPEAQIIVNITEQTRILDSNNTEGLTFEAFQVDQKITLESNGIMTDGQVDAIEITLLQ